MRTYLHIILFSLSLILFGCEKEETPISLPPRNDSIVFMSATMGEQYTNEVFVNFKTGERWNFDNISWDLQFESSPEGNLIKMNGGKGVLIAASGFTQIQNLYGYNFKYRWDNASGMKDSIVLGNWLNPGSKQTYDSVYVIDRGTTCLPAERFFQFQIKSVDPSGYELVVAPMNGVGATSVTVRKDTYKQHVYFTFESGGRVLNVEPPKTSWHLHFLRYRWIYYEFTPPLLYTVCGVFINNDLMEVAVDSTMDFNQIRMANIVGLNFSDQRDVIGYDWKVPDFSKPGAVTYTSRKFVNYIIRMKSNPYELYKLHFIGFYDQNGLKGSPQFEVSAIHP